MLLIIHLYNKDKLLFLHYLFCKLIYTCAFVIISFNSSIDSFNWAISSSCCNGVERVNLGGYSSPIEAYNTYKIFKEQIIKEAAEQAFKNNEITVECYNALMKYEVEITD